ncbi:hypothetical protein [Listeria booriae]|uniref:hypothetical protein n=1 Tax=Listeria booriae TaxID=1552123 RepID=UPI001628BEB0|nr:hypothetical protein [Listeria booriae]MBC1801119.1 hypothetical protein [Listeria booriae]
MTFKLPPIPEFVLTTSVTITGTSLDDNGDVAASDVNTGLFRVRFSKEYVKTQEGIDIKHIVKMHSNPLGFNVKQGDLVAFLLDQLISVTGVVEHVTLPLNPDGSIHHVKIIVSEVREVGIQ